MHCRGRKNACALLKRQNKCKPRILDRLDKGTKSYTIFKNSILSRTLKVTRGENENFSTTLKMAKGRKKNALQGAKKCLRSFKVLKQNETIIFASFENGILKLPWIFENYLLSTTLKGLKGLKLRECFLAEKMNQTIWNCYNLWNSNLCGQRRSNLGFFWKIIVIEKLKKTHKEM